MYSNSIPSFIPKIPDYAAFQREQKEKKRLSTIQSKQSEDSIDGEETEFILQSRVNKFANVKNRLGSTPYSVAADNSHCFETTSRTDEFDVPT